MIERLKNRFYENISRHPDLDWEYVEKQLLEHPEALESLKNMEESGGEPDTIGLDDNSGQII